MRRPPPAVELLRLTCHCDCYPYPCCYGRSRLSPGVRCGAVPDWNGRARTAWARRLVMARKRGFFAEMAHQAAVAEKNRQRAQAAAVRAQAQLQREAERAQRQFEQALRAQSDFKAKVAEYERQMLHEKAQ